MTRLLEILKRCEAATPGPWETYGQDDDGKGQFVASKTTHSGCGEDDNSHSTIGACAPKKVFTFEVVDASYGHACNYHENAEFIAHARTDLPLVVRALKVAICRLEGHANSSLYDEEAKWAEGVLGEIQEILLTPRNKIG